MAFQGIEERIDPGEQAIVDNSLVFQGLDLVFALVSFLVNLRLLRADERTFVDVRVDFDIGVIAELKSILLNVQAGCSTVCILTQRTHLL